MNKHYIIPIFVPHLGCPHGCVFCNQEKITGLSTNVKVSEVKRIIDEHLATFEKESFVEVAFYGGSFTAIDTETQEKLLAIPLEYKSKGIIQGIRLSTRPDAIDESILEMLANNMVDTIELGVQSLDETVLKLSERGHSASDVYKSTSLIKSKGFKLGLQIMLGLPGDDREKSIQTAKRVLNIRPDFIRIYPTLVIKGTSLENMMKLKLYQPLELNEAVELSSEILMIAVANEIDVIRIGLQPTENIQEGKDVVGGPFHPAFRQLVESRLLLKLLEKRYGTNSTEFSGKNCTIYSNRTYTSIVAGQKSRNRFDILQLLGLSKLNISEEPLRDYEIRIKTEEYNEILDLKKIAQKIVFGEMLFGNELN
jgi:histone acetyltransferase (RNA polymerase elongator complex component)